MKNRKIKLALALTALMMLSSVSLMVTETQASKKEAAGWKKYDFKTESCVTGRTTCIIP